MANEKGASVNEEVIARLWRIRWRLQMSNPGWPSELRLIDEAIELLATQKDEQ